MTKDYHLTPEHVVRLTDELGYGNMTGVVLTMEELSCVVNAALDKVLGEPVGEVEVRKQRILIDTFQQVTTPIADGRHKLYAPRREK